MLAKLLPFELNLQFRQIGFWITISILFLAMLFLALNNVDSGNSRVKINGSVALAIQISAFSIFAIFFGAIFVVSGVMRDDVYKSLEIVHATPVNSSSMIIARFFGAWAATFVALLAMVLALFTSQFLPFADRSVLGPVNVIYYLWPVLLFVTTNAMIVTAIFCTVAMVTRNRTLVYVSSVALLILFSISSSLVSDNTPDLLKALLSPFGETALAADIEFWSPEEQNTRLIPFAGNVALNRIVWTGIGFGLFAFCFFRFKRGIASGTSKSQDPVATTHTYDEDIVLHRLKTPLSDGGFRKFLTRVRFEYLSSVQSVAFIILVALILTLSITMLAVRDLLAAYPTLATNFVISRLVFAGSLFPLLIISVFFSGEIIWRDRVFKMTELIDSTRTANWPLMAGKWVAMLLIVFTILFMGALLSMTAQMALGDIALNPTTHFQNIFLFFAPVIFFYCTLIMFIQNFMPNRIVGMVVGGIVIGALIFGLEQLSFYHPLMNFGELHSAGYSEINGFAEPMRLLGYLIYWLGLVGLFVVASIWLWRRGVQTDLIRRIKSIRSQLSVPTLALGAVSLVAFIGTGSYMSARYANSNFLTEDQSNALSFALETDLGEKMNIPLPKVKSVEVSVDIFPETNSVRAHGTYIIENTTGKALAEVYVSGQAIDKVAQIDTLVLDNATWANDTDLEQKYVAHGIRLFKFKTPLAAGAQTRLSFDITQPTPIIGKDRDIRNNGTFVTHDRIMPQLGIPDLRLRDPDERRRRDLPEYVEVPDRDNPAARQANSINDHADYVDFKATVCTAPAQTPIAPGRAVRTYEKDGRACADFQPNEPIIFFFAFVSAEYEVREDTWTSPDGNTVDLAIYYDGQHNYNIDVMVKAMKDALDIFTETFGPYQFDTLRILEFPYGAFAQAFAGTIPFSENVGFVVDPGDDEDDTRIDLASYVTMHEVGHQWFGHQLAAAKAIGFNVLIEGLTENATFTAYEEVFGWQKTRRLLENRSIAPYLQGRVTDRDKEPPLATAGGLQQYIIYAKAGWVFWGLKHYIGDDAMQGAIGDFLTENNRKGPPYPTTLELIEHLRAAAGPDYQQLITDYFERLTFWNLEIDQEKTALSKSGADAFRVDLNFTLDKRIASSETGGTVSALEDEYAKPKIGAANDTDAPKGDLIRKAEKLNEWIEIGFYDIDPSETLGGDWIKLERVHITEPDINLSYTFKTQPTHIVLDPRRLLIETNVRNNIMELELPDES